MAKYKDKKEVLVEKKDMFGNRSYELELVERPFQKNKC